MMERERSAIRKRFDLFMNTHYVRDRVECKDIYGGDGESGYKVKIAAEGCIRLRTGSFAPFGVPSEFPHDLTASYGQREELFMFGKGLCERRSVIDDYIVFTKAGFCKMTAVGPAENHDLITVAMKL